MSKTIAGTDLENVFDITLQVRTPRTISEVIKEPDMAVVIVMDISNTMNSQLRRQHALHSGNGGGRAVS